MAKNQPEKSAFKIIEVDEKMLNLEKERANHDLCPYG